MKHAWDRKAELLENCGRLAIRLTGSTRATRSAANSNRADAGQEGFAVEAWGGDVLHDRIMAWSSAEVH